MVVPFPLWRLANNENGEVASLKHLALEPLETQVTEWQLQGGMVAQPHVDQKPVFEVPWISKLGMRHTSCIHIWQNK